RTGDPKAEDINALITRGENWLKAHPRSRNTPEGLGVQFILGYEYYWRGKTTPTGRAAAWATARRYLAVLDGTENEYSTRAQEFKFAILDQQGAFKSKVEALRNFDDCYVRALYENQQLSKNPDKFKTEKDVEAQRRLVVKTLERGFDLA